MLASLCFRSSLAALGVIAVFGLNSPSAISDDPAEKPAPVSEAPKIEIAILLDTSNSMDGLINQAKAQLWKIVNEFATAERDGASPELRVALYEYGKSSLAPGEGYLRQITSLTDDLDRISEELFALTTNGGDEYCGQVIAAATKGLDWSSANNDLKLIVIAGNEPFTQGSVDYKVACKAAIAKGVIINTIFCGPEEEGIRTSWKDGAVLADGTYSHIDQNQAVATINTPYDKELSALSGNLNKTYVAFGAKKQRQRFLQNQEAQDSNAALAAPAAAAERAQFKAGGLYDNSARDLVDAIDKNKVRLDELKAEELPEELKGKSTEEQKEVLAKKAAERAKIQARIQELSKQRNEYVAGERKRLAEDGEENSLEGALSTTLRRQAESRGFQFSE
ncbi:VWA domain-containing protein [Stratiformator vulcanicus]|uniref:VWFA domain-containing protein n=1 Tax=Stratiformator vulcanicus TaxID=2527980 RepID=A0A517R0C5_9PLAN|nr:vWA domain-containing protein [Stratiformator vulcanicus]QDT37331.1 hypothetical protein Pan189_17040 [Stratiformator vulcanicus]